MLIWKYEFSIQYKFFQKIKFKKILSKINHMFKVHKDKKGGDMLYFSYNDFSDFIENRKIDEIKKVEENTEYYKIKNAERLKENNIVKILKEKIELKNFLENF